MITQILTGHTNETNAYLVSDYPYGRQVRCRIRYWVEYHPKKGFRFCSQTENPRTLQWNNPKRSTYSRVAGMMFLDGRGYVSHGCISEYDGEERCLQFIKNFPTMDENNRLSLSLWCKMKTKLYEEMIAGRAYFTINDQKQEADPAEIERYKKELKGWQECVDLLKATS